MPAFIKLLALEKKKGSIEVGRQARKGLVNLTGVEWTGADSWTAWWEKNKDAFVVGEPPLSEGNTVVATIKRNRANDFEELKKGRKEEILILLGDFDGVQDILESLKVPHTVSSRDAFGRQDLSRCRALLINCTFYKGGRLKKGDLDRIRDFVNAGGYLFTSDWGMADVVEEAFPGYIQRGAETAQMNTAIFPKKGAAGHPLLREVFTKVSGEKIVERTIDHAWEIDAQSYTINYDASKVVSLVEAPELPGAVAVTFFVGAAGHAGVATGGVYDEPSPQRGGRVLHVLSHFSKQKTKNDGYTLQNMLLNFLIEAKDRKRPADKK